MARDTATAETTPRGFAPVDFAGKTTAVVRFK
jgi:hypothetical protein